MTDFGKIVVHPRLKAIANRRRPGFRQLVRLSIALLGFSLLLFLVRGAGPSLVADQVKAVGWGLGVIIALGGISHLTKTLAWRLTFLCDIREVPFARTFALRLISEAIGSLGLPGQVLGETARVYLLGSALAFRL
jgi:hypothetical protein